MPAEVSDVLDATQVATDLARLRTGTLDWIRTNAGYLDAQSGRADLPPVPRAKSFLQLAGLYRAWKRSAPDEPGCGEIGALVRDVWRRPELPDIYATEPRYDRQYSLMYAALAPEPDGPRTGVLARLQAGGYLKAAAGSPYLRLEIAYYANMAGVSHGGGSYADLYAASLLAGRRAALPITGADACAIAHTVFYLSDYGMDSVGLERAAVEHAREVVVDLTEYHRQREEWDNVAKFVLAQTALGLDPLSTPSGAAGIRTLVQVQRDTGEIPGGARHLALEPAAAYSPRFRRAYQTTLMTAMMALIVSAARR